jgi:hypothetical protein
MANKRAASAAIAPGPEVRRGTRHAEVREGIVSPQHRPGTGGSAPDLTLPVSEDERVFHAREDHRVMQMDSPAPFMDAQNPGRVIFPKSRTIVFREGEFRTRDEREISFIENAKGYGIFFWDAVAKQAVDAKSQYNRFKQMLAENPSLVQMLKQDLSAADFNILEALAANADEKGADTEQTGT